jgi:tyrosinase
MNKPEHPDEYSSEHSHEHSGMTFEEAAKQERTLTFSSREILHKISIIETLFHEGHIEAPLNTPRSSVGFARDRAQLINLKFGVLSSRPRRNHLSLTTDERNKFNKVIEDTISSGAYSALVAIHSDMSHNHHRLMADDPVLGQLRFLSWHRAYLFQFEKLLAKDGMRIPYWDWANDQKLPDWVHLPAGVTRGPDTSRKLPTQPMVDTQVLSMPTYVPFTIALEEPPFHNTVHMWVGGTMQNPMISPRDPIFWLHHANVDRIWAQWQEKHPNLLPPFVVNTIMDPWTLPPLSGVNAIMDPWTLRVEDIISTYNLRYYYE